LMAEAQLGKSLQALSTGLKGSLYKKLAGVKRDSSEISPPLVDAVFSTPPVAEGKTLVRNVEQEDGSQVIFKVLAQRDGVRAADSAKMEESAKSMLAKSEGQREFSAWVATLREAFDVHTREIRKTDQE